jgi:manganese/zinc/iron transport system permease protein
LDWLLHPNSLWVLGSSTLLGISSGVLGSFALLRRRSLLGDALAHAALPGIGIAFLIFGSKDIVILLAGAIVAGLAGAFAIQLITRYSRIKEDAALGLVLSVFFAIGIVLLTRIQHSGAGNQSGLDKFLFGQAASMVGSDVLVMAVSAAVICLAAILFFKEFKLLCFDASYARGLGFSPQILDGILMTLIVLLVVIGMQAVGVVLMAAMLITPAAAARLWTERLDVMIWLAGIIGAASGIAGTWLSTFGLRMPTGPLIVIAASAMFAFSLVLAPRKGIIASVVRLIGLRSKVGKENVLRTMYEAAEDKQEWDAIFTAEEIAQRRSTKVQGIAPSLRSLLREKMLKKAGDDFVLTEKGLKSAYRVVRNHRLWEMYLMHQSQIDADHVHRDADEIEHFLSPRIIERLEELLKVHERELRLPDSVHSFSRESTQLNR